MNTNTVRELALAWSDARGLDVEWQNEVGYVFCFLAPNVRLEVGTCEDGFSADLWVEAVGEWEMLFYSWKRPTATEALDTVAKQAEHLCAVLGKLHRR